MSRTMPSASKFSEAQATLAQTRRDAKHALRKALAAAIDAADLYDQMALAYREQGGDAQRNANAGAAYAESQMRDYEKQAVAIEALLKLFPRD